MPMRNIPIRRKLMTVNLLTSGAVLLLTCTAFLTYEIITLHKSMLEGYTTRAQIIAANSTASLAFQNDADAADVLGALKTDRRIVAACIYDSAGKIFTKFPTNAPAGVFPFRRANQVIGTGVWKFSVPLSKATGHSAPFI